MIVSFGELLVDMIKHGSSYAPFPGGAPANFAVAVSRLGLKSKILACVGKEPFGDFLVECVIKEGVDTTFVKRSKKQTTLAFVELKEDNTPDFFFYRGADVDISPDDVKKEALTGAKHVHCGGLSLTNQPIRDALFRLLSMAKEMGITTSFSPNLRPDLWEESFDRYLEEALASIDVLIASRSEFEHIARGSTKNTEASAREIMKRYGITCVVVTMGTKGAVMVTGDSVFNAPAFAVRAADTTGSGDAFAASLVCGMEEGMEGDALLRFASAAAALSVTKMGAMSALPTRKEVDRFLSKVS